MGETVEVGGCKVVEMEEICQCPGRGTPGRSRPSGGLGNGCAIGMTWVASQGLRPVKHRFFGCFPIFYQRSAIILWHGPLAHPNLLLTMGLDDLSDEV